MSYLGYIARHVAKRHSLPTHTYGEAYDAIAAAVLAAACRQGSEVVSREAHERAVAHEAGRAAVHLRRACVAEVERDRLLVRVQEVLSERVEDRALAEELAGAVGVLLLERSALGVDSASQV